MVGLATGEKCMKRCRDGAEAEADGAGKREIVQRALERQQGEAESEAEQGHVRAGADVAMCRGA